MLVLAISTIDIWVWVLSPFLVTTGLVKNNFLPYTDTTPGYNFRPFGTMKLARLLLNLTKIRGVGSRYFVLQGRPQKVLRLPIAACAIDIYSFLWQ